jgi:hypothetical protein
MDPTADPPALPPEARRFVERLRVALADGSFVRLTLDRHQGSDATLQRVAARRVLLRGQDQLSFVYRHATKDITKNLPLDAAVAQVGRLVAGEFNHAHLLTRSHDVQLALSRKGRWGLRIGRLAVQPAPGGATADDAAAPEPALESSDGDDPADAADATDLSAPAGTLAHDRARQRQLDIATPFLAELGVTDSQHRLVPAMARKWRQINKFVELLSHAIDQSPLREAKALRVLDFGSGKGYLTFAVHHHLVGRGVRPEVTGVELRDELCALCNAAVQRLDLRGLQFVSGDVRSFAPQPVDVMIALHACDTATDLAMHRGIRSGAAIIMCSPCCHKQLRPQMHAPPLLQPMLRHGIHMGQQAEMVTDSLRALLLQAAGYDTQVFEFISLEHTSKNKMVLAVKRASPLSATARTRLLDQVVAIKAFYGIREQCLEQLLAADTETAVHAAGAPAIWAPAGP